MTGGYNLLLSHRLSNLLIGNYLSGMISEGFNREFLITEILLKSLILFVVVMWSPLVIERAVFEKSFEGSIKDLLVLGEGLILFIISLFNYFMGCVSHLSKAIHSWAGDYFILSLIIIIFDSFFAMKYAPSLFDPHHLVDSFGRS